ncbi:MAG: cysteine--tRNA ligase [Coriobacteriales bacterium]|nr:cysteine--tRNA ligase [Coriobacteriales bacterium]
MRLYNTLTRSKEEFKPAKPGQVGFYLCGPTVYNDIHIGNARTFIVFDVVRRYLIWRGYQVTFVQNITDVDDKIIDRAKTAGMAPAELAADYDAAYRQVMEALGVLAPDIQPHATAEIEEMIKLASCLVESGHAYELEGSVYFDVRSDPDYGKLSHRDIDQLKSGARIEVDVAKHDPLDFAVWKAAKPGEPAWDSPWGQGRPGWHLECSTMAAKYLGLPFDIHAGGNDLIFPHHENEIAQAECCGDREFAHYWLHSGMLTIDQAKMSKSEGNYLLLKDVLQIVNPQALRLLMLQTHYRSPFDYSPARLDEAKAALARIREALRNAEWKGGQADLHAACATARQAFQEAMDDDFNTAQALAALYDLIGALNKSEGSGEAVDTLLELLGVLGIDLRSSAEDAYSPAVVPLAAELTGYPGDIAAEAVELLLERRAAARADKDFELADRIRDRLAELGLGIKDTAQGSRLEPL